MTETITATSSWTPEGGTPITITKELEITAIVIDPGAGSSIHEAKSAFLADNTNNSATINLANVEVIGQYGNYLYLQDLDAGLLVYGSGAPSFNKGDKFTSGTLSGTLVFYPANNPNGIVELTEFTFVDQSDPDPGQELTVTPTTIADLLNDNSHTYEHRYVELSGVSFDEIVDLNWTLVEGAGSLLLYDRFGVGYATLTPPTVGDLFTVRGVVNPYYANNTLQQQMSPTGLGDIHTTVQAGAPVFTPMGGPQGHAVSTTSVTITPADNTTVEYNINEGDDRLETSQEVTIPITGLTIIEAFASRDFYENSSNYSYYYDLPSNIKSVTFHINGVNGGSVLIEYEHNLTASRCPTVNNIDGYVFRGWSTAPNSTSVITLPYQITANLDLFAVYTLPSSYDYVAISTPSQISAGEYVIVGDDGRDHFYTLKNLHCSSTPMAYPIGDLGLAKVDNKLVGNDYSQVTWTFEGVPSAMTISSTADSDLYLYTTSNATGVRVGYLYEQQTWTFCEDNILNGFFNLKFNPQSRYLTLFDQNTTHDWRCYTLSDMYGANSHPRLTLYKKTPNFTATDPSYTRVFTDEEASQAIIINGPSVIPSGRYLSMGSWPFTNTLGTEMFVIESGATFTPAVGATQTIQATVKKAVTGYGTDNTVKYGWYLLASPVGLVNSNGLVQTGGGQVSGLYGGNDTNYDLYAFDQDPADGLEWRNNKAISGGTSFGNSDGILYASQIDRTITYSGTLVTNFNGQTLACSGNGEFKGWNLIGNPYTCNAYLLDENGEIMPFYRMNDTGDTIVAAQLGTAIKPCEGVFVVCPGDGQAHQAVFPGL